MTEGQALAGRRIVVTRAGEAGERFVARLRDYGAEPIVRPLIAISPPEDWGVLDDTLARLDQFDWLVCTSANAVAAILDRLARMEQTRPATLRIGAVGDATAAAFVEAGWRVDIIPTTQTAEGLVAALGQVSGQQILFPASDIARTTLADGLRARGATVTTVAAYRTITLAAGPDDPLVAALRAGTIDAVTLTSPSTVRSFLRFLTLACTESFIPAIVCVGPTTAAAAREAGLPLRAVAADHSEAGLLEALDTLFARPIESTHRYTDLVEGAR